MVWKQKLSRAKQTKKISHEWKINLTHWIWWSQKILFAEPNCCISQFCLPGEKKIMTNHQKTPRSVSAVLASRNLLLWILTLPPLWHWCSEKWWMIEAFSPPHFFSFFCVVATLSPPTDAGCVWSFPLSGAGAAWMQSQPSVRKQTRRKIEHLHQYLQQSICFKWNINAPILKLPADKALCTGACGAITNWAVVKHTGLWWT